jgi:hypothetical protein
MVLGGVSKKKKEKGKKVHSHLLLIIGLTCTIFLQKMLCGTATRFSTVSYKKIQAIGNSYYCT